MNIKITSACVGLIILISWQFPCENSIDKIKWLMGTWENKSSRGSIYETWTKVSATEMNGKSYALKDLDTIFFETIKLVQEPEGLFYIPTVKNQNDMLPVIFTLKSISESEMIFENPDHDFPQMISYSLIEPDSLVAEISGIKNGNLRKQQFPMKRIR